MACELPVGLAIKRHEPGVEAPKSEAIAMARLAKGDISALGELYDAYADTVRRFALRTTGEPAVAEDVTHDTFVALVDAAKRYDDGFAVRSFVVGIAGKLVLRRRRRLAVAGRILRDLGRRMTKSDVSTPEDRVQAGEELEHYRRALARLTPAKRVALIMADVEGMAGAEIAAALQIPIGTVWTRVHHGRRELREAMRELETWGQRT